MQDPLFDIVQKHYQRASDLTFDVGEINFII